MSETNGDYRAVLAATAQQKAIALAPKRHCYRRAMAPGVAWLKAEPARITAAAATYGPRLRAWQAAYGDSAWNAVAPVRVPQLVHQARQLITTALEILDRRPQEIRQQLAVLTQGQGDSALNTYALPMLIRFDWDRVRALLDGEITVRQAVQRLEQIDREIHALHPRPPGRIEGPSMTMGGTAPRRVERRYAVTSVSHDEP